jgi:single-strand DNA-binding protein
LLYLEGKIQTRSWDDKDGNKKYITEIHCFTMQMLGGGESKPQAKAEPQRQMKDANDDLPF